MSLDGKITGFISFYLQHGTAMVSKQNFPIQAGHLFYYACQDMKNLPALVVAALHKARDLHCDVFSCLEVMDNISFFKELKFFADRDNQIYYHLFKYPNVEWWADCGSYQCPFLQPKQVGVVFW